MPENSQARCGTSPIADQRTSGASRRTSTPPTSTLPPVTSNSRGTRLTIVLLPAPVDPITATVWPGRAAKETSRTTGESAPG